MLEQCRMMFWDDDPNGDRFWAGCKTSIVIYLGAMMFIGVWVVFLWAVMRLLGLA